MPFSAGTRLGPYEIQGALGAGGMGEVYRARDTRLDRDVAIKVLSGHFAGSQTVKERFEREARTISQLSHPNICQLFDVGSQDGADFLVMEYLEGETLADRLVRGPLTSDDVLRYGAQIADALDRAHQHGIIHRDLKPGNIIITKSGAKVLDFGLAKQAKAASASATAMTAASSSKPLTAEGTIVGTFQYMAPEQVEGGEADPRTDIFALGCVLYEMASGKRAFSGKSQASVMAAILAADPTPLAQFAPMTPPGLDRLVRSCLAKEREQRIQSAHDVKLQLDWLAEAGSQAGLPAPLLARRRSSQRLAWAIAAAALLLALAFAVALVLRAPVPGRPMRLSVLPPAQHEFNPIGIALSPDGSKLAFITTAAGSPQQLWVRALDSSTALGLNGTEDAIYPFWSPDSRSIGFFAEGKLKIIDTVSGNLQTVADAPDPRGASWGPDGTILYSPSPLAGLFRVPSTGGTPTHVDTGTNVGQGVIGGSERWPVFLPDGNYFLFYEFTSFNRTGAVGDIHVGALDKSVNKILVGSDYAAQFSNGYLGFVRDSNLMLQPFDLKKLALSGTPVPIAEQIRGDGLGVGGFGIAGDKLVFASGQDATLELAFYDRSGKKGQVVDTGTFQDAHISPDGKKVSAAKVDSAGHLELFLYDLTRATKTQFSFSQTRDDDPVWSPDGNTIIFDSARAGRVDLYTKPSNGSRQEQLLYHDDHDNYPGDWSLDGKYVLFEHLGGGHVEIWAMPMVGEHKPFPVLQETYSVRFPVFSPDGKWVAYTSFEAGRGQVYLAAFPKPAGRFLVGDGSGAVWTRDGKEIIYQDLHSRMVRVAVSTRGDSAELGTPQPLFYAPAAGPTLFEVAPDGKRLLLLRAPNQSASNLTVVLNWFTALKH